MHGNEKEMFDQFNKPFTSCLLIMRSFGPDRTLVFQKPKRSITEGLPRKKWTVKLPWIDPEPKSQRLTDNLRRVTAR